MAQEVPIARNNAEFFGYLLVSQLETVEAVTKLDNQYDVVQERTLKLESTIDVLGKKCSLLEETINSLKNLLISYKTEEPSMPLKKSPNKNESQDSLVDSTTIGSDKKEDEVSKSKSEQTNHDFKQIKTDSGEFFLMRHSNVCFNCTSSLSQKSHLHHNNQLDPNSYYLPCNQDNCKEQYKEIQRLFNKRVKYEVNRKFGSSYLAEHQVRELDVKEMHRIKKKVLRIFEPFPIPIKIAWSNAMNSLRQDRHQLKKKRKL